MSQEFAVTLTWVPSVDPTVVNQVLNVSVNGVANPVVDLSPTISTYTFNAVEKAVLVLSLAASNGPHTSPAVTANVTVPALVDVVVPTAPTGLNVAYNVITTPATPTV